MKIKFRRIVEFLGLKNWIKTRDFFEELGFK